MMKQLFPLKGIVTLLNTPFTMNDSIDHKALNNNVNEVLKAGVAGFLVSAMASEACKIPLEKSIESYRCLDIKTIIHSKDLSGFKNLTGLDQYI